MAAPPNPPSDPFLPADLGSNAPPALELARDPHAARAPAAGPGNEPDGDLALRDEFAPRMNTPSRTLPVIYKNPDGGMGRFIVWGLAAFGLAAAVVLGGRAMSTRSAAAPPQAETAPAAAEPAAPVQWKALAQGDNVLVRIDIAPREARAAARLMLDGAPLPSNPVHLAKGSSHTITAVAEGYEVATVAMTAQAETPITITLRRTSKH